MSRKPNHNVAKRAAKRKAQREARARGLAFNPRQNHASGQMTHGSSARAIKKRREGQRAMEQDHDQ